MGRFYTLLFVLFLFTNLDAQTTYYWAGLNSGLTGATSGTDFNDVNNWSSTLVSKTAVSSLPTSANDVYVTTTTATTVNFSANCSVRRIFITTATVDIQTYTISLFGSGSPISLTSGGNLVATSGTVEYGAAALNQTILTTTYNHLLLTGTLSRTCTGSLTVLGNLTINGPTFAMGAFDHYFSGNFTRIAGSNGTTGTIYLNGSGDQTFSTANTVFNMVVSGGGTKTINSNVVINNQLTIENGTIFNCADKILYFRGLSPVVPLVMNGTGTLNCGTGTVVYDGAGNQNVVAHNYNKLTVTTGIKTMMGNVTVASNIIINTSTTLSTDTFELTVQGTPSVSGTLDASNGTLTYNSTSGQNFNNNTGNLLIKNLNLKGTGTKTLNKSVTVTGVLTLDPGAVFNLYSNTLTLTNTLSAPIVNNGGTWTPSNSTVIYAGAGPQDILGGVSYKKLEISGSGTKTLAGNITVSDSLKIGNGTVLNLDSRTLTVSLNGTPITTSGSGTISAGSGTVVYSGATQNVLNTTYYNLTINCTTATLVSDITIDGVLTINTSRTLSCGSNTINLNFIGTPLVVNGSLTTSTGKVVYNASGNQNIAPINYYKLQTSGSGTKSLTANSIISDSLIINNTTLDVGTNTLSVGLVGNPITLLSGGTLVVSTGVVNYSGLGDQTILDLPYYSLSTSGSDNKTLSADLTLNGLLTIGSGTTFNPSSFTITLNYIGTPIIRMGSWQMGSGKVVYSGSGAQNITSVGNYFNLETAGSGVKSISEDISVANVLTIGSGTTFSLSNKTLSLVNVTTAPITIISGGTFDASTGTVSYNGVGNQTIINLAYYNLNTGNNGGTKTLASSTTINGILTVNSGTTLAIGTSTLTLNLIGTPIVNNGTITNSGTVIYNANGNQEVANMSYHNLETATGGVKTLNADIILTRLITIRNGSTLNLGNKKITVLSQLANQIVVEPSGVFSSSTGTVEFGFAGNQNVPSLTYFNLTMSASGNRVVQGPITVLGALSWNGPNIIFGNYTHYFAGNIVRTSGSHNATSSTFVLNGTGDQTLTVSNAIYNLTLRNGGVKYIGNNTTITNELTIEDNTTFNGGSFQLTLTALAPITPIVIVNNGLFEGGTGTVIYSGVGNQNIAGSGINYYRITCTNGIKTLMSNTTVSNITSLSANTTLNTSNYELRQGKEISGPSTSTLDASNGTLTFAPVTSTNMVSSSPSILCKFLKISGLGTTTLNVNFTVTETATIEAGATLSLNSNRLTLTKTGTVAPLIVNGTFNYAAGTISYAGAGDQVVTGGISYFALRVSGGGVKKLAANANVRQILTIEDATVFDPDAFTLFLPVFNTSSITTVGTGSLSSTSGTVSYNGGGAQTIVGLTYYNLITAGSGTKTVGSNLVINGVLNVGAGTIFSLGSLTMTLNYVGTPFVASGTSFAANTSTVIYNALGNQDIINVPYYNIITRGSGTKTATANINVSNVLTIDNNTTFDLNSRTLNLSGVTPVSLVGSGSFTTTTGTVNYRLTGNQNIIDLPYYSLLSSGSGTKTLQSNTTLNGTLTVSTGTTINLNSYDLTLNLVGTPIMNYGTINSGTGSIVYNGDGNQSIANVSYYKLATGGSGTKSLGSNASVSNVLTIGNNTVLNIANYTLSLSFVGTPPIVKVGSGTMSVSTGTVNYNGMGDQSILDLPYYSLQTGGSGIKTLQNNTTLTGILTVGSSTTFDLTSYDLTLNFLGTPLINNGTIYPGTGSIIYNGSGAQNVAGINYYKLGIAGSGVKTLLSNATVTDLITINNNCTLNISDKTLSVSYLGNPFNIIGTGSIITSIGRVIYSGLGNQIIANFDYNELEISGNGIKTLLDTTTLYGVLILGDNTSLNIGTNLLNLYLELNPIQIVGTGTLSVSQGTVNYTASGHQTIVDLPYYNLQTNNIGTKSLSNSITLDGVLTIGAMSTIDIGSFTLTLNYIGTPIVNNGGSLQGEISSTVKYSGVGNQNIAGGFDYSNLTLEGTGTKTLLDTTSVFNTLTINSNTTFDLNSKKLNLYGAANPVVFGSFATFISGTGIVNYCRNGNQTIQSLNYYSLQTSGTGIKTLQNILDINGVLTIGAGTTLASSSYGIVLNGTGTPFVNNGTFDPGTGYVRYRTGVQDVAGATYYDLQLQGSAIKTLTGNTIVLNSIDIVSGSTFKLSNKTLDLRNVASSIFTGSGSLDTETSTVQYNGAGNQSVYSTSYYNLDILNSGTKTISNDLTINSVLTIGTSATLDADRYNITLNYIGTPFVVNGAFIPGTGQVEYRGTGNQNIAPTTFYDLQVSNSGIKYINGSTTINGRITANGSVTLQLNGGVLTLNRTGGSFNPVGAPIISLNNGTTIYNASGNQDIGPYVYDQLVCQGSGTKKMMDETTVLGSLQINNVNFDVNGTLLTLEGDNAVINTSGTGVFKASTLGSEVHYASGLDQIIYPTTYRFLFLSQNSKSLSGYTIVSDQLVIFPNTLLKAFSNELDLLGDNIPFINSGTFDGGTGLVRYAGRNQQVAQADYYGLSIRGGVSYVKTLNSNINVNGELQIRNDGNLNLNGYEINLSMNGYPLVIDSPGIFNSTGTVNYSGDGIQYVLGILYDDLIITNTGSKRQQGDIICNGRFIVETDAFYDFNGGVFIFRKVGNCAIIDGTTDASTAFLQFDGAGDQDIPNFNSSINEVLCTNLGTKTMTGDATVNNLILDVPLHISNYDLTIEQTYPNNIDLLQMGSNSGLHLTISNETGSIDFTTNSLGIGRFSLNNNAVSLKLYNGLQISETLNLHAGKLILNGNQLRLHDNSYITRATGQIDASNSNDLLRVRSRQSSLVIPEGTFVNDELNELIVEGAFVPEAIILETDLKILENIELSSADINLNGKSLEILGTTSFVCEPCFFASTTQSHLIFNNSQINNLERVFFENDAASKLTVKGVGTEVINRGEWLLIFNELNVTNGGFIDIRNTNLTLEYTAELFSDAPAQIKLDEGSLTAKCASINANYFVDNTLLDFRVSNDWLGNVDLQGNLNVTSSINLENSDLSLAWGYQLTFTGSALTRTTGSINAQNSLVFIDNGASLLIPGRMFSDISELTIQNTEIELERDLQVNEKFVFYNASMNTNGNAVILGNHIGERVCNFNSSSWTNNDHINGRVVRYYNDSYSDIEKTIFPIGNGLDNRQVAINFLNSVEGYLSVEFVPGLPGDAYSSFPLEDIATGNLIRNADASGYWEIIPYDINLDAYQGDMDVTNYNLTLRVKNPSSYQNGYSISDPSAMRLIKAKGYSNGSHDPWEIDGTISSAYDQSTGDFYIEVSALTGFSWFNVGSTEDQPLPVTLTAFNAHCDEESVHINWSTASEHNSANFELEKSRDGAYWNVVNTQNAAGHSTSKIEYSFSDIKSTETTYYRLIQNDINGDKKIYDPIVVDCDSEQDLIYTFPNPSNTSFSFYLNSTEENKTVSISIVDELGRTVGATTVQIQNGINVIPNPFTTLGKGIYTIQIKDNQMKTKTLRHVVAE